MDDVFSIDGKLDPEALLRDLEYITELAKRATQPPPKLNNDPEIQLRYQRIRTVIIEYGKD